MAVILLCAGLCACVGDGDPQRGLAGGGPPRRLPNVFISPAGEPFRAPTDAPYPVAAWFARADTDRDGRLTRAEMRADGLAFFDRLDANHDGVIDGLEVQDYEQTVAPEILPRIESLRAGEGADPNLTFGDPNNTEGRADQPRRNRGTERASTARGVGLQGAAVYSLINAPEPVTAADAQFDGRITRAEFADTINRRFDSLDKAGVGYLTLAGLPNTPLQIEILKRRKAEARRRKSPSSQPTPS